jgi:16S rRNA (uracil1498-N3)-methyltransferase
MRRFFIQEIPDEEHPRCVLDSTESHHLFRVVKIAKGEEVILFDGKGHSCVAILDKTLIQRAELCWIRDLHEERDDTEIWLYLCLLKQQAWSTSLRMATELGVHHIVPVVADRSIVRKEKKDRWESIILSSTKQCGRAHLPQLHSFCSFSDMCSSSFSYPRYILAPDAPKLSADIRKEHTAVCIGPEGGYTQAEINKATQSGWVAAGLGSTVLRADTAVVGALSLLLLS